MLNPFEMPPWEVFSLCLDFKIPRKSVICFQYSSAPYTILYLHPPPLQKATAHLFHATSHCIGFNPADIRPETLASSRAGTGV